MRIEWRRGQLRSRIHSEGCKGAGIRLSSRSPKWFSLRLEFDCLNEDGLTSSRSVGRILRVRRPSENLSNTLLKPFIKDIFSSRDLVLKLDRSRKFSVDIGSDEKNG